jgi:hypothetical protein
MESIESQNLDVQAQIYRTEKPSKRQIKGQKIPIILNGQAQYINKSKLPASNIKNNPKNSMQITK